MSSTKIALSKSNIKGRLGARGRRAVAKSKPAARPKPSSRGAKPTARASRSRTIVAREALLTSVSIEGIDVSKFQVRIDWARAFAAGKRFCFLRASDGINPANETTLPERWGPARSAGFVCGAYHYFRPSSDMNHVTKQAALFLRRFNEAVTVVEKTYLPAVIDVEQSSESVGHAEYARGIKLWIDEVERDPRFVGRKTIIYTRASFWREIGDPTGFEDHPVWVADYSRDPPRLPKGWSEYTFFQYTEKGKVDGIAGDVDLNRFNGDFQGLDRLLRPSQE